MTSSLFCATGSPATSNTITMTVNPTAAASVSITASDNPICTGTSVTFTATPANGGTPTYQWFRNGTPVGSNSPTYTNAALSNGDQVWVVMTSSLSCATGSPATSNTITMSVSDALPVSVSISANQNPVCTGTSVTFTATPVNGGTNPAYQWLVNGSPAGSNNPVFSSATLANGDQVQVVLTSDAACATGSPATSNTVTITMHPHYFNSFSVDICSGETYTLPDGSVVSSGGTYIVNLISSQQCDSIIEVEVNITPTPAPDLGADLDLCEGVQVVLSAGIEADIYVWNTGENTSEITISSNGNYSVTVFKDGCSASDGVNISFNKTPPPPIYLGADTTICEGDVLMLSAGITPGVTYLWQDGSTGSSYFVDRSGVYYILISNECGTVSDTITIGTDPCLPCGIFVPSAFSPNGDGINDRLTPINTCDDVAPYRFSVFNRWNEIVFDTDTPGNGWDGIYKGEAQPLDTFVYSLSYFNPRLERIITHRGVVTLLR